MESANIDSMCRCCAAEGMFKDIKTSYHWMGEEEVYGDMLRECFDVKLSSVEEGGICEVCITQLRNAANFKKQVLHTEKKFKRHLETRRFKPTEVKEEVSADNDNSSDDDRGADSEDDEDYVPEFEIPIKTETPEESKSRKRSAKATTSRAKKSRVDDDKSNIFNYQVYQPVKTELDDSKTSLVKLEANDDPTQTKRRQQIKAKQTFETVETIQIINLRPAAKLTSTKRGIKIEPPTEPPPVKKIKVKSKEQPTRRKKQTELSKDCELVIKSIKIAPPSVLPKCFELDKHRYNIRTILQCSNATPIRYHYVGSGFLCSFCKSSFIKAADLKTHTIHDHDEEEKNNFLHGIPLSTFIVKLDITSLMCNICSMSINTLESLIEHLNSIHQKGLHTDVKNHIACFKFDGDGEAMKCYVCSVEYQSFKFLYAHMNKHITNFICNECGAGFINKSQLRQHSNTHKVGAHKCDICDEVFNSAMKMRSHKRRRHTGIALHMCQQCPERFKTKNAKHEHIEKAHGIVLASYKCDACDRTFKTHDGLRVHRKRDHLMERNHVCQICDRRFFSAVRLRAHQVTHTGARDFKCELCSKTYSRRDGLMEHMRSHTNDRRFKCSYCDMAFLQKCSLKGHLRSRHDAELE